MRLSSFLRCIIKNEPSSNLKNLLSNIKLDDRINNARLKNIDTVSINSSMLTFLSENDRSWFYKIVRDKGYHCWQDKHGIYKIKFQTL
jgi:hypothetical protein